MDYKSVIEEQIRELQKRQDNLSDIPGLVEEACRIAKAISDLTMVAASHKEVNVKMDMDKLTDILEEGYAIELQEGIASPYFITIKPCGGNTKIKEETEIGGVSLMDVINKAYELVLR